MKVPFVIVALMGMLVAAPWALAQEAPAQPDAQPQAADQSAPKLETSKQKASYFLGVRVAGQLPTRSMDLNAFMQGVRDASAGKEPALTREEIETALAEFQQQVTEEMQAQGAENQQTAQAFLEQNKTVEGVQTTESGLQYKVLQAGSGESPGASDTVKVNYKGTFLNGQVFDESDEGDPVAFEVGRVIPGFTEALQLMKKGAKWRLWIPPNLGYGMNPPPTSPIQPNQLLVFDVELVEVTKGAEEPRATIPLGSQQQQQRQR